MYYYKFKRSNLGKLHFIMKCSDKYEIDFNNGVFYSENEIENVSDLFLVPKMRVVKSGKTWLNNFNKKLCKENQ
jgi:hypothetical protein